MLSEKVKGKQRAVDVPQAALNAGQSSSSQPEQETARDLVVRFTEGAPDLTISVEKQDSVREIKKRIRDGRPELFNRRLRLIHSGRLLTDGTFLYSWLSSLEERQKRAHGEESDSNAVKTAEAAAKAATTWIHCSVGPVIEPEEAEEGEQQQATQIKPPRGFDRLTAVGFSPEDIENFRRQFHSQSSANYLDHDFQTEEEYDEHARALEEQWIDSMDDAGTAAISQTSVSSNSSVLQGILLGFFFPFLPFFFMRSQKPAVFWEDGSEQETTSNVIFSRRMQMGIAVGFFANLVFGVWRYLLDSGHQAF
ncbi:DUF2407 C-terminal domain-containing protein [Crepidotus variabilis]|uniref:DUF2407 C-terminal domain-containing protein n=1 Tax=Crepidotus variabilis TaxID=179855 RepID=A0A9P6EFA3_9AGAR|nr:DUF2407 C-terminal domain-containing protein [Crepidotus variabilis]